MTKHPFYNQTPNLVKEILKGAFKLFVFLVVVIGIGFGCNMIINIYPQIAAFTHIYEYTNTIQASILSFLLLMTYLVAYALPILLILYFTWVIIRELYLKITSKP